MEIKLESLVGEHILTGVDFISETINIYGDMLDVGVIIFCLDGITYKALEDPDDGWRSCLSSVRVIDHCSCCNVFDGVEVVGTLDETGNLIYFVDKITKKEVLVVGTDYSDDYYPLCIMQFNPENMSINAKSA